MTEHWCKEHKTIWFKKGNMKSYAHPIKDDEGQTTGWCNEPEEKVIEVKTTPQNPPNREDITPHQDSMSKNDWAEKDKITRKSIERQVSLKEAVELVKTLLELKLMTDHVIEKVITAAKRFELFLETGIDVAAQAKQQEVTGAKSRLVEEAKKLGGKVIEEGGK